jgi:acyl carrier protein
MREKILEILKSIRPDVDFEKETKLIDDDIIDSFDVIQIATEFMDAFDIDIDADDIEPEKLNNVDAMVELVESRMSE